VLPLGGDCVNGGIDQAVSWRLAELVDTGFSYATMSPWSVLQILKVVAASSFYRLMLRSVLQKNEQVKW
jgi:hypothetical protein